MLISYEKLTTVCTVSTKSYLKSIPLLFHVGSNIDTKQTEISSPLEMKS